MSVQLSIFDGMEGRRYSRSNSQNYSYSRSSSREQVDTRVNPLYLLKLLQNEDAFCGIKEFDPNASRAPENWTTHVRKGFTNTFKFVFQFVAIMGILYLSAIVFAYLEDPSAHGHHACKHTNKVKNSTPTSSGADKFSTWWNATELHGTADREQMLYAFMESAYNFSHCDVEAIALYVSMVEERNRQAEEAQKEQSVGRPK